MREKLNTLPLSELKELAKEKGLKGISSLRKAELVELICQAEEPDEKISEENEKEPDLAAEEIRQKPVQKTLETPVEISEKAAEKTEKSRKAPERTDGQERANSMRKTESGTGFIKREPQTSRKDGTGTGSRLAGRMEGKQIRVVNRHENRNSYQNRGRSQDNGMGSTDSSHGSDRATGSQEASRTVDRTGGNGNQDTPSFRQPDSPIREGARPDGRNAEMNQDEIQELDSGMEANGILEVMPDGFGFIRCENFLPGENDVYVAPSQIRRFNMKTGDMVRGNRRVKAATEKFAALLYVTSINGYPVNVAEKRPNFEDLTPIFPNDRIHMETAGLRNSMAMRVLDLMAPIGKGQRGLIVSPPKAGKTTLLKQVAKAITTNQPRMHLIILLIDERPEEVTDIKEAIVGENVEVIYSTFDELPERHKRVSEMVIERARRLVEHGRDVTILLDSITRLARAYNLVVPPSGRTLSGGLDPAALHMPKRFFGAARNMREGGSLTILGTALIDTGSRMDDVIYEEFKGTGNMELVLDRKLSEKRIFPAIDILKSGTRRDDLLLTREEAEAMEIIRRGTNSMKSEDSVEKILDMFTKTKSNKEIVDEIRRRRYL